jgi:glycosyltransferase involved in cell wall biosynthesis
MDVFPAKMMQYIACGKATVATALRGITTLLPGESHGVVYADNAANMAKEVVSLLKSEERRQTLERNGLSQVREAYNHEKIARELENILEEAIKNKRHGTNLRT